MHTVFKFNRGIVFNSSKYDLAEGVGLKKLMKVLSPVVNNVCSQDLNENIKRYLIRGTRALDLLCQVRACMLFTRCTCCNVIYLHMYINIYIHIQCVQVKCISRLFAQNLNDFNIHLFVQTVWQSASPSLNVQFDLNGSLLLYF